MSLKKEKLLSMVEGHTKNSVQTNGECSKSELIDEETEDDFVGTKCRVKHVQEYGGYQYHNSIVLSVHRDQTEQIKVVVLFLNPTQPSMIPCKYFLSGNCTFADSCKFSHGYEVDLNDLLEYEEPDFSLLSMGGKCLAKYEDGVWHKATVHEVHDEVATISYDGHADDTHQMDLHSLLPLPGYHSNSSSDAEDEQCDGEIGEVEQTSMKGPMADWEQYTKGIGSKLMMKMGYIFGKGLGKNGEGRTEPVEIRLLPPGKSLDYIAELREKGHIRDPTKNKAKKLPEKPTAQERTFTLINNLTDRRAVNQQQSSSKKNTKFGVEESYKSMKRDLTRQKCGDVRKKETKHSTLNVEMLRNSEQLSKLKKKLAEQKKSLARNPGDTSVSRTIKHKISQTEKEIRLLEEDERRIEQKLNIKSQTKKLSIF